MGDRQLQHAEIEGTKLLKPVFERQLRANQRIAALVLLLLAFRVMLMQKELRHGRNHGAGKEVRGQHGKDHGFGQRHKEVLGHAAHEEHGHKDDADGKGGDEGRDGDLRGAIQDCLLHLFAFFEIAIDIFDFDGGVVDQDADGQRQATQGHDVDGLAQGAEHDQRDQDGKRNGNGNDEGAAPAAQKDQDHDAGEAAGDDALAHHAVDGAAHKNRLIRKRRDAQLRRQLTGR